MKKAISFILSLLVMSGLLRINVFAAEYAEAAETSGPVHGEWDAGEYPMEERIRILLSNMELENETTRQIMEIACNFWEHRDEFIYCSATALDQPWNYWSYTGYIDSANTGITVTEENAGYKRIDCSTFVRYVVNGIDYYSTPYYNALELTEVEQGGLEAGAEMDREDITLCRTGEMYIRPGKRLILEARNSNFSFTKVYGYDASGTVIQTLEAPETDTVFVPNDGVVYLRAEMRVTSPSDYEPASEGVPAAILRCLRIREDERLEMNAGCPLNGYRNANQMCKWFEENGYALEYGKDTIDVNELRVGSVIFWGKTSGTWAYKNITHNSIYIGSGYVIHVSAPYGLLGGEGVLIETLENLLERYDIPLVAICSPRYHTEGVDHVHDYTPVIVAPSCMEPGGTVCVCAVCGDSYTMDRVDAAGHKTERQNVADATCATGGYTGDLVCVVCGEITAYGQEIEAPGHMVVIDTAVFPTLKTTGLTEGSHCAICGEVLRAQEAVSFLFRGRSP